MRDNVIRSPLSQILKGPKLAEKDKELEYWHRTFPAYDQIPYSASLDRVDRPSDSDQDSQSTPQNSTTNNPLPPPPRPVSLAAYRRTAIPEVQPQPYLGTGSATFIPGARHEDRVIPPPELFSYLGPSHRHKHHESTRDHSHRSRRKEDMTEEQREERKRRHRERAIAEQRARDGEDDSGQPSIILPGNLLGIGSASQEAVAVVGPSSNEPGRPPPQGGYVYALYPQPQASTSASGANAMRYVGIGSSSTNVNVTAPAPGSSVPSARNASHVPRMGESAHGGLWAAPPPTSSTTPAPVPTVAMPVAWTPYAVNTASAMASHINISNLNHGPTSASAPPQPHAPSAQDVDIHRHRDNASRPSVAATDSAAPRTSTDSWGVPQPNRGHHSRNSSMSNIFNDSRLRQLGPPPEGNASRESLEPIIPIPSSGLLGIGGPTPRATHERMHSAANSIYAYPVAPTSSSQVNVQPGVQSTITWGGPPHTQDTSHSMDREGRPEHNDRSIAQRLSTWGGPPPVQDISRPPTARDERSTRPNSRTSRHRSRTLSEPQVSLVSAMGHPQPGQDYANTNATATAWQPVQAQAQSTPYVPSPWVQPASTELRGWPFAPAPQLHTSAAMRQPYGASMASLHSQLSSRTQASSRSGHASTSQAQVPS